MSLVVDQPVAEGSEPTAPGSSAPAAAPSGPGRRAKWLLVGGAVVASMMAGWLAFSLLDPSNSSLVVPPVASPDAHAAHRDLQVATRPISQKELARKYGIRLTLVGVTASGGLVDLRFKITDASKAKKLFTSPSVTPAVIAEPTGTVVQAPHGGHHGHIVPTSGASYFILMGNPGGVVQRGVPVTVVFNTVRVEHIVAKT